MKKESRCENCHFNELNMKSLSKVRVFSAKFTNLKRGNIENRNGLSRCKPTSDERPSVKRNSNTERKSTCWPKFDLGQFPIQRSTLEIQKGSTPHHCWWRCFDYLQKVWNVTVHVYSLTGFLSFYKPHNKLRIRLTGIKGHHLHVTLYSSASSTLTVRNARFGNDGIG